MLAYNVIPSLILGMKRCVKVFDSTFSIYHTFCFTTFVFTPAICFLLSRLQEEILIVLIVWNFIPCAGVKGSGDDFSKWCTFQW